MIGVYKASYLKLVLANGRSTAGAQDIYHYPPPPPPPPFYPDIDYNPSEEVTLINYIIGPNEYVFAMVSSLEINQNDLVESVSILFSQQERSVCQHALRPRNIYIYIYIYFLFLFLIYLFSFLFFFFFLGGGGGGQPGISFFVTDKFRHNITAKFLRFAWHS